MIEPTIEVTRRTILATIAGLSGTIPNQPEYGANAKQKSAGRLLFENDTERKMKYTVAVVKNGVKKLLVTPKHGRTITIQYPEPLSQDPPVLQKSIVDMQPLPKSTVARHEYIIQPGTALKLIIPKLPGQSTLFYTYQPWSKRNEKPVANYGKIRCSTHFDVYLSSNSTQSTCGSRLSRIDDRQAATEKVFEITKSK